MRASFLMKVVGLTVLGILSSLLANQLVGQVHTSTTKIGDPNPRAAIPPKKHTVSTTKSVEPPDGIDYSDPVVIDRLAKIPLQEGILASSRIYNMTVQFDGQQVKVGASAAIREKRPRVSLLWGLKVMDSARNDLDLRLYDKQVIKLPAGIIDSWPTFKDAVNLPSGDYKVQLALYEVTPDLDISLLKTDPGTESQYRAAWMTQDVTVRK
jgi:hypothetical protein